MSPLNKEIVPLSQVPRDDEFRTEASTILVVDDERIVADTLSAILRQSGFRVRTAYNAEAALKIVADVRPDLLITDVAMPGMNGVQLAVELLKCCPKCKILLFSGHASSVDLVTAFEAGHNFRLLAKPLHPTEMIHQVSVALEIPEQHPVDRIRTSNVIQMRTVA